MLDIIQKKHKDRYRIQFCNEKFYREHQSLFALLKFRFNSLENAEKLQAWVTVLSCLRRPTDWYGGPRALTLVEPGKNFTHRMNLCELFEGSPIVIPSKLSGEINIFDFLNSHRIKALPESCFRSLCYMKTGRYPLSLSSGVISPFDLLKIQLRGERIVSMDEDFESWPEREYSGRDYLGFILHDLIHADHFFFEPKHRDGQLGFYRFVNGFINEQSLISLLESSSPNLIGFRGGFEYIISDMNSHPLHLFQTLHSLLFKTLKNDVEARDIWQFWIQKSAAVLTESEISALLKINHHEFSPEEALCIEFLCEKLSQFREKK
jgi:hypothetical protein